MAEGAPLLREYTLTRIEGSNPSLSAIVVWNFWTFSVVFYTAIIQDITDLSLSISKLLKFSRSELDSGFSSR